MRRMATAGTTEGTTQVTQVADTSNTSYKMVYHTKWVDEGYDTW